MKKICMAALFSFLMLFCSSPLLAGEYFDDVNYGDWFYEEVNTAYEMELVNGVSYSKFNPYGSITRGMFVTILGRMDGINPNNYYTWPGYFYDVDFDEYYNSYINWAYENDIIDGTGVAAFSPDSPITREQIAKILYGYIKYAKADVEQSSSAVSYFTDESKISSWAREGMDAMRKYGIIAGDEYQRCNPQNPCSRAEGTAMILRLLCLLSDSGITDGFQYIDFAGTYNSSYDECINPEFREYWEEMFFDYRYKKEFVAAVIPFQLNGDFYYAGVIQRQHNADECSTVGLVILDDSFDLYAQAELFGESSLYGLYSIRSFYADNGIFIFISNNTASEYGVYDMIHFNLDGYYYKSFGTDDVYQFRMEGNKVQQRITTVYWDYDYASGSWQNLNFNSLPHTSF